MISNLPKISIITPSFNQGQYLEETILSVLGQNYSNLEYIIIDGGSTDNSVEIIKKYEHQLAYWVSEKDNGQSHGINKGFAKATGDILGWLNSDDLYMPTTLQFVASEMMNGKINEILIGNCIHFREGEGLSSWGSDIVRYSKHYSLNHVDYIIQPSSFWTRELWLKSGLLNETLHFGFDWEWFLRAQRNGFCFNAVQKCLSLYRFHDGHKSSSGDRKRQQELLKIYVEYAPKYARLFERLMVCNFKSRTIKLRIAKKVISMLQMNIREAKILKILHPNRFKGFTIDEIEKVSHML